MVTAREKQFGFYHKERTQGGIIEVVARHRRRLRAPTNAQISRNIVRNKPAFSMTEEEIHEWVVLFNGQRIDVLRLNPNGSIQSRSVTHPAMTAVEVARALIQSGARK